MVKHSSLSSLEYDTSSNSDCHIHQNKNLLTYNDECCVKTALAFVVLRQRLAGSHGGGGNKKALEPLNDNDHDDDNNHDTTLPPFLSDIFKAKKYKHEYSSTTSPTFTSSSPTATTMLPPSSSKHHLDRMMRVAIATAMPLYNNNNNTKHNHKNANIGDDCKPENHRYGSLSTTVARKSNNQASPTLTIPTAAMTMPNSIITATTKVITSQSNNNNFRDKNHTSDVVPVEQENVHSHSLHHHHHRGGGGWVYDYDRASARVSSARTLRSTSNAQPQQQSHIQSPKHELQVLSNNVYTTLEGLASHLAFQLQGMIHVSLTSKKQHLQKQKQNNPYSSTLEWLQTWIRNTFLSMSWNTTHGQTTTTSPSSNPKELSSNVKKHTSATVTPDVTTTTTDADSHQSSSSGKNSTIYRYQNNNNKTTITITPMSILAICTVWHRILHHDDTRGGQLTFLVIKVISQILQELYNDSFTIMSGSSSSNNNNDDHDNHDQQDFNYNNTNNYHDGQQQAQNNAPRKRRISPSSLHNAITTPRLVDILTVNLVHLLEGIVFLRLQYFKNQHAQKYARVRPSSLSTTTAQDDLILELQQMLGSDLWVPFSVSDMAHFYYTQQQQQQQRSHDYLTPSGKIMLRLSLYDMMQKIVSTTTSTHHG